MKIEKFNFENLSVTSSVSSKAGNQVEGRVFQYFAGALIEEEEKEFTKSEFEKKSSEQLQKGYDEGYKRGLEELKAKTLDVEVKNAESIKQIADSLQKIYADIEAEKTEFKKQFLTLCMQALKKVSAHIFEENAYEIFAKAIDDSLPVFSNERKVIIKAEKKIIDLLKPKLENIFAEKKFTSEVIFEEDNKNPNICKLQWDNSGIIINLDEKLKHVEEIFVQYLKSLDINK